LTRVRRTRVVVQYLLGYLRSIFAGSYRFTPKDLLLSLRELYWRVPGIELLAEKGGLLELCIDGVRFYWPKGTGREELAWLYGEIFYPSTVNPSSYQHGGCRLEGRKWVMDAGAGEGFFSLVALAKGAGIVLAVEALEQLKPPLEETFREEIRAQKLKLVSAALGKEAGTVSFCVNQEHFCASAVEAGSGGNKAVPSTTIDLLCQNFSLRENGFIKMDIEGSEMDALRGARGTLRRQKPMLAIAVYHGYDNALECRKIIIESNPSYRVEFRGMYYKSIPPRPYMLFAW